MINVQKVSDFLCHDHCLVYSDWYPHAVHMPVSTLATPTNSDPSSVLPHPVDLDPQMCPRRFQDTGNRPNPD